METAVIVLVDGGGGCGPIFTVDTPLSPVICKTEKDEERDEDEGGCEDEVTLRAAHHLMLITELIELLCLGGVEDVRGVGTLTAVMITVTNHSLTSHPSYPLSSRPG